MQHKVAIFGAGVMGQRLARHFSGAGFAVALIDPSGDALEKARSVLGAVDCALAPNELAAAWKDPDLVIEAVPEILRLKQDVLAQAEAFFDADVLIASNTSGLTTAELSQNMRHPERLAIAHFFNPADIIPVVELIAASQMPLARLEQLADVLRASGKLPAILHKELPGFVANRIQHAMMRECLHLLEQGVADAQTLDEIIRWSIGVRLAFAGPFMQRDLNGLDTHLSISKYLYPDLSAAQTPFAALADKVAQGALGRKAGQGFYDWTSAQQAQVQTDEVALAALIKAIAPQARQD